MPNFKDKYKPLPTCPHCGGLHFGQRFDDCCYVKLANDATATEEQKTNARTWLEANRTSVKAEDQTK